jgi:hypothetical protein
VKDENGDLLADSHNILNRWNSYFSQLLNVHNVSDVRQIEVHTAEPFVPGPSHLAIETAIAKLKKYKSPDNTGTADTSAHKWDSTRTGGTRYCSQLRRYATQ